MANRNLPHTMLYGGLSVNLNHLIILSLQSVLITVLIMQKIFDSNILYAKSLFILQE